MAVNSLKMKLKTAKLSTIYTRHTFNSAELLTLILPNILRLYTK